MFQSSPVTKDGRYGGPLESPHAARCFNPRPSLRTGATPRRIRLAANVEFQSSPVTKDGRYSLKSVKPCGLKSFNPRPSLRTGAT